MGVAKKTRKFGAVKRIIGQNDSRLKQNKDKAAEGALAAKKKADGEVIREVPQVSSALFFQYNTALVPPYSVLVDTCLYAECKPIITSCVMAELEKLGPRYRIALRIAKDPKFNFLQCDHRGTYADDCLVDRVQKSKIYIVATNDRDLKRRIRKIPGVPIMSVARGKYVIERLPDAPEK